MNDVDAIILNNGARRGGQCTCNGGLIVITAFEVELVARMLALGICLYTCWPLYKAADGGQAFMDTKTGVTTPGSTHCRTELREMTSSGPQAAWAPSGANTMDVTGKVTLLGGASNGKVTVGQVTK